MISSPSSEGLSFACSFCSSILLQGAGNAPCLDVFDALPLQYLAAGLHGAAGGDDIVDQRDAPPGASGTVVEGAAQVVLALAAAQAGLGGGGADALQTVVVHRQAQPPAQLPGNQQGLVEASFEQPLPVQGNGHQHFDVGFGKLWPQPGSEAVGDHQPLLELELVQQAPGGTAEGQRCAEPLPGRWLVTAAGADRHLRRRTEPAQPAGTGNARQAVPAMDAQVVMDPGGQAAEQAFAGIDQVVEPMADIESHWRFLP